MNINNPLRDQLAYGPSKNLFIDKSSPNTANQLSEQIYNKLVQALYNRLYFQLYSNISFRVLTTLSDEHK